jgi:formylglycine-generating enzyme required for sulfatase activity
MHGNALEWTQSVFKVVGKSEGEMTRDENEDNTDIKDTVGRVLLGGSFFDYGVQVRSASRHGYGPTLRNPTVGFRPARTFPP